MDTVNTRLAGLEAGDTYARQSVLDINRDQRIAVVGCGGVGSWVALELALAGVRYLDLFDADTISEHNRNRLPVPASAVGKQKSLALAELIATLRPDTEVMPRGHFNPDIQAHLTVLESSSWIVVSTDSMKSRRMVHNLAHKLATRYIELGAEGHGASVTFSPPEFATPDEENPGYRSVPVFVGPCVIAASIAVYYVLLGNVADLTHQVGWTGEQVRLTTIHDNDEDAVESALGVEVLPEMVENGEDEEFNA